MIRLRRVSKVYGAGAVKVPALSDITFDVRPGEFVVLAGPSGAGKTSLLRLLYGDDVPTEGDVEVLGSDVAGLGPRQLAELRRGMGIVFQDAKLLPARTVFENLAFVLHVLGTPRREVRALAFDALRAVGLSSRAHLLPAQLSLGERQRAALARAIMRRPSLLVADEPTGNLDEAIAGEIMAVIAGIAAAGTTVVMATHQRRLAAELGRRTLVLEAGRLVKDEPAC